MKRDFWKVLLAGSLAGLLNGGVMATSTDMKAEDMAKVIVTSVLAGATAGAMNPEKKQKVKR